MFGLRAGFAMILIAMTAGAASSGPRVSAPRVIRRVPAEYSEEAREKGMRGTVVLGFVVNSKGRAEQIWVIRSNEFELGE